MYPSNVVSCWVLVILDTCVLVNLLELVHRTSTSDVNAVVEKYLHQSGNILL